MYSILDRNRRIKINTLAISAHTVAKRHTRRLTVNEVHNSITHASTECDAPDRQTVFEIIKHRQTTQPSTTPEWFVSVRKGNTPNFSFLLQHVIFLLLFFIFAFRVPCVVVVNIGVDRRSSPSFVGLKNKEFTFPSIPNDNNETETNERANDGKTEKNDEVAFPIKYYLRTRLVS